MSARPIRPAALAAALLLTGCHSQTPAPIPSPINSHDAALAANKAFLDQNTYDPWVLTSSSASEGLSAYFSDGNVGSLITPTGSIVSQYQAGRYKGSQLEEAVTYPTGYFGGRGAHPDQHYRQAFNLHTGSLTTRLDAGILDFAFAIQKRRDWPRLWQTSDIAITGDPQAQQVTHANLFYLLSSTFPGSTYSIPPMGLSSSVYGGHIFWDADVWMLPALVVQHPEYAKPIVDYRFKLLGQARENAQAHGYKGAEYPWESADTGKEVAPAEFAQERHITADVAFAAWQYYLWTGDRKYLQTEGWPLLEATAQYWASRVTRGEDGKYHLRRVLSPDETAGVVNDDAYTNAVVQYNLRAAATAAHILGRPAGEQWARIADNMAFVGDHERAIVAENDAPVTDRFRAKQADALLLLHPLGARFDPITEGRMLDFYSSHTITTGPAMTSSIEAIVAARLGRAQQSLDLFHDSYRPFMRAPWDAFSEKRTTNNVYFLTGMAGCVQSVLYGFAGLQAVSPWQKGTGQKLRDAEGAALYCDPHLPPGWGALTVKGVRFRGATLDITILPGNKVSVTAQKPSRPSA